MSELNPYAPTPEQKPVVPEISPIVRSKTLSNPVTLLRKDPAYFERLFSLKDRGAEFGKTIKLLGGTPIVRHEYILVEDEETLDFMAVKGQFKIKVVTDELIDPVVTVEKYRSCGGKALVLLSSAERLDSLYNIPLGKKIWVTDLSGKRLKQIKPGGKGKRGKGQDGNSNTAGKGMDGNSNTAGKGMDGNSNTAGKGMGYPNCLGYTVHEDPTSMLGELKPEDLEGKDPNLKVAILDSGIRFREGSFRPNESEKSCKESSRGWDFVDEDSLPADEQINLHGTRVANIIHAVCPQAGIIPVRVSNENNVCTLYDVLCGLEYAGNKPGVRIINASLAFLTDEGVYIPLLQAALRRLAYKGILVVCAAGNVGNLGPTEVGEIPPIGTRRKNWYVPMRWPACSCADLDHVISVTSLEEIDDTREPEQRIGKDGKRRIVCEVQSQLYVTIGTVANGAQTFGTFQVPGFDDYRGTSFAAPYVTGLIAKAMHEREDLSSREEVLKAIGSGADQDLLKQVHEGLWVKASLPRST